MTPEGKVKERVKSILRRLDIYWFCPRGTAMGRSGIPDFVCCYKGAFVGIETKAGSNKPTALQVRELELIRKASGFSFVVNEDNLKDLEPLLIRIGEEMDRVTKLAEEDAQHKRDAIKAVLTPTQPEQIIVPSVWCTK